jgi:hypothetical protein
VQVLKRRRYERDIEREFVKHVWITGGWAVKCVIVNVRGFPDRLVLHDGRAAFFEFKLPGEHVTDLQQRIAHRLAAFGFSTYVCQSIEDAIMIYDTWRLKR